MIIDVCKFAVAPVSKWPIAIVGFMTGLVVWYQGLAQPWQIVVWLAIFILADTITGLAAAAAMGEPWESNKLKRLVVKVIAYVAMPLVVFGVAEVTRMPDPPRNMIEIGSLSSLVFIEGVSILENIVKMRVKNLGPIAKAVGQFCRMPLEAWLKQVKQDGE